MMAKQKSIQSSTRFCSRHIIQSPSSQDGATGALTVLNLLDLNAAFQLLNFRDDVFGVRKALTLQFREDQSSIQHNLERRRTTNLSADDGGGVRVKDLISELIITRSVASRATVLHVDLHHQLTLVTTRHFYKEFRVLRQFYGSF